MSHETIKNLLISASLISVSAVLTACGGSGNNSKNNSPNVNQHLPAINASVAEEERALERLQETNKQLKEQIQELENKERLANTETNQAERKLLEKRIKQNELEYEQNIQKITQEKERQIIAIRNELNAEIAAINQEKADLEAQKDAEIAALNQTINDLQNDIQTKTTRLESVQQHLQTVQQLMPLLENEVRTLNQQKTSNEAQIARLNQQISTIQSQQAGNEQELANLRVEVSRLQTEIRTNEADITQLNASINQKNAEIQSGQTEISRLRAELVRRQQEVVQAQQRQATATAELAIQTEVLEKQEAAALTALQQTNQAEEVMKRFRTTMDDIQARYDTALAEIDNKINAYHTEVITPVSRVGGGFKAPSYNYDVFVQEIEGREQFLSNIEVRQSTFNQKKLELKKSLNSTYANFTKEIQGISQLAAGDLPQDLPQPKADQSQETQNFPELIKAKTLTFEAYASTQQQQKTQQLDLVDKIFKENHNIAKKELNTWKDIKSGIDQYIKLDDDSISKWQAALSNTSSLEESQQIAQDRQSKYAIIFARIIDDETHEGLNALRSFFKENIISDLKAGKYTMESFLTKLLTDDGIRKTLSVSRLSKENEKPIVGILNTSINRVGDRGAFDLVESVKKFMTYHLTTSPDSVYLRTLFSDTAQLGFAEAEYNHVVMKKTFQVGLGDQVSSLPPAATAAALSATVFRDGSDKVSNRQARTTENGSLNLRGFNVNGAAGESIALGMPLFVQLKGDVSSSKSTEAATGSVAYRLGNTVIGAIQGYANSGEGFGVEGRQLETSIVASHSFGAFFIEGQIGTVSATDVHDSNWKGMRSQVTLGIDTEFVSPFVQVAHRQLDRSGIDLNQTTAYVGVDMDVAKLKADSYTVDTRLLAKVGYGDKAWSVKAHHIGTTSEFSGSVEWSGTLSLNSGVTFTTNLGLDTVAGSSAAVNVSLDR